MVVPEYVNSFINEIMHEMGKCIELFSEKKRIIHRILVSWDFVGRHNYALRICLSEQLIRIIRHEMNGLYNGTH